MLDNPTVVEDICKRLRELNGDRPPQYLSYSQNKDIIKARAKEWVVLSLIIT